MIEQITSILVTWLANGIYTIMAFAIGVLWNKWRAEKAKQSKMERGLRALLRSRLRDIHERAVCRGWITYDELQDAEDNYESYHGMGGNGRGTDLIKALRALPVKGGGQ